jgi:hypothetical protein
VVAPSLFFLRTYWIVMHAEVRNLRRVEEVHGFILGRVKANRTLFL